MAEAGCLFCRIARREARADIVAEADGMVAFKDINPQALTHLLIVPSEHIPSLADLSPSHTTLLGQLIQFAGRLARQYQLTDAGFRVIVNTGPDGGQTVPHLHVHVLGGRPMRWPPG